MSYLEIRNLRKSYAGPDGPVPVLGSVTLSLERGEFVSIFGPNGCGKSTLLSAVAGLTEIDAGSVTIDGVAPDRAKVGFVFQNYTESLFPWLRNVDNIGFALASSMPPKARRQRARDYVKQIGLDTLPLDKYPYECSGGERQLVALAREAIYEPDILLLDEPFASLDFDRRLAQQRNVLQTWERTRCTTLMVSHDLDEAIYMADRFVLLSRRPARIEAVYQIALPRPRRPEMLKDPEFLALRRPIFDRVMEVIQT